MRIAEETVNGITIITLAGDEDTKSEDNLARAFRRSFDAQRYYILLDLEKLKYLGSRMLRAVLSNTKEALNTGGKVKLLSPQPAVKKYLKESRIIDFFETYNTRQLALESFEADRQKGPSAGAEQTGQKLETPAKPAATGRVDRIENQLLALVSLLRAKGVLTDEEESSLFP